MLNWQQIPVPFAQGVDTKSDPLQIPVGKLSDLTNGRLTKTGQITKRLGTTSLTTAASSNGILPSGQTTFGSLANVVPFEDQLVASDGNFLYSYSPTATSWITRTQYSSTDIVSRDIMTSQSTDLLNPDVAILGNAEAYVYQDGAAVKLTVVDRVTRAHIQSAVELNAGAVEPKLLVFNGSFLALYVRTSDNALMRRVITATTVGAEAQMGTITTSASRLLDAMVISTALFIATDKNAPGAGVIELAKFDTSFTVSATMTLTLTGYALDSFAWLDATSHNGYIAIAYAKNNPANSFEVRRMSTSLTGAYDLPSRSFGTTADSAIRLCGVSAHYRVAYFFAQVYDGAVDRIVRFDVSLPDGTIPSLAATAYGAEVTGKPFFVAGPNLSSNINGAAYLPICYVYSRLSAHSVSTQGFVGLLSVLHYTSRMSVVAKAALGLTTKERTGSCVAETPIVTAGTCLMPAIQMQAVNGTSALHGVSSHEISVGSRSAYRSVALNSELFIAGGAPHTYDGVVACEAGFVQYPEAALGTLTAGAYVPAGTYQWCFTYQWTDAHGVIHESAPSVPIQDTQASAFKRAFSVSALSLTEKTDVRIVGWRTRDIASTNDLTFYRFTSATSPTMNTLTANSVTITDDNSTFAATNEVLYTTGGALENSAAPAIKNPAVWKNRVWGIGSDSRTLWYSKLTQAGYPIEWSDALQSRLDDRSGPITALFAMDSALLIFTPSAIFSLSGEGPDNTGKNNDYGFPNLVTTDVGCANPDSLVTMPNGVMFQSAKGIYLLSRSFQASYIGAPVEAYNAKTVSSAVLMPDANEVRFTCSDSVTLVYNYLFDQWSTFDSSNKLGAGLWRGTYFTWTGSGVKVENSATYDDDAAATSLSLTTGWLALSGFQGYQRVRDFLLLANPQLNAGAYIPHTISVELGYDYDPAWSTPVVFDSDKLQQVDVDVQANKDFTNSIWVRTGLASVVGDLLTADAITPSNHLITQTLAGMTVAVPTKVSIEMKPGTAFYAHVWLGSSWAEIDLLAWTASSSSFTGMTVTATGSGWYRFEGTAPAPSAATIAFGPAAAFGPAGSCHFRNPTVSQQTGTLRNEQLQVWVTQPRCEALRARIIVTPKSGSYTLNPCTMSGLTLRVGAKRGLRPQPTTRRIGAG